MNNDQSARFQRILEDANRGLLPTKGIKIGRKIEEYPKADDIEHKLCLLERMLLDRYRSISRTLGAVADAALVKAHTAENKLTAKVDFVNQNRTAKAQAFWSSWRARWLEIQADGTGPDIARTIVGTEIKNAGSYKNGKEPSWSTLNRSKPVGRRMRWSPRATIRHSNRNSRDRAQASTRVRPARSMPAFAMAPTCWTRPRSRSTASRPVTKVHRSSSANGALTTTIASGSPTTRAYCGGAASCSAGCTGGRLCHLAGPPGFRLPALRRNQERMHHRGLLRTRHRPGTDPGSDRQAMPGGALRPANGRRQAAAGCEREFPGTGARVGPAGGLRDPRRQIRGPSGDAPSGTPAILRCRQHRRKTSGGLTRGAALCGRDGRGPAGADPGDRQPDRLPQAAGRRARWPDELLCPPAGCQLVAGLQPLPGRLPYIQRIIDTAFPHYRVAESPDKERFCADVLLRSRVDNPCFLELIWSYWTEEGMLVQSMNAIGRRFQNLRAEGRRDPLAHVEIDPLRPLTNILWGYVEDEGDRLSVRRRAYEYQHHYGLNLVGKAVSSLRPADKRSEFIEAFHNLLNKCAEYYRAKQNTTVDTDGFPILHAIQELNLILAQGAHNQFGDLPWTSRVEMLMQQWIMARPEIRDFLQSRAMVPYKETWMHSCRAGP